MKRRFALHWRYRMMARSFGNVVVVLSIGVPTAGCLSDAREVDPGPVSTLEQDVKTKGFDWGVTSSGHAILNGVSPSTHTCFLSGVFGDLMPMAEDLFIGQGVG